MKKSNEELFKLLKDFTNQITQHVYPNQIMREVTELYKANNDEKITKEAIQSTELFYENFLFPFIKAIMNVNEYKDTEECRDVP